MMLQMMGMDMTDQTARAEDAADPPEAVSPTNQPAAAAADAAADAAELKDRLLRTLAEMENLRKRTAREVTEARLYGVASFAGDMLAVADNMRRALDAVSPALRASAEPGVKALIDGEVIARNVESVTCRWCGHGRSVEVITDVE